MVDLSQKQKDWLKTEVLNWSKRGIISQYQVSNILKEYNIKYEFKEDKKPVMLLKL